MNKPLGLDVLNHRIIIVFLLCVTIILWVLLECNEKYITFTLGVAPDC